MVIDNVNILIIEDDLRLANFLSFSLEKETVTIIDNLEKALDILKNTTQNLLIIDLNLLDSRGLDTLYALKAFKIPKIVVTERPKDLRLDMKSLGIIDYISKTCMSEEIVTRIQFNIQKLSKKTRFDENSFKEIRACIAGTRHPFCD